jgi:transcription factor E
MREQFLKEVVTIVAGKQTEGIVDLLNGKKNVNEFIIAKKLNLTINQTRNILYKLSDYGLVSSIRKKDKKKGWYTYFWKIEILKSFDFLKNILEKNLDQITHQLKSRETKLFYICERCNIEFNEENALNHDFICNECGNVFTLKDSSKILKELKKDMEKIKKELEMVNLEILKEKEIEDKEKMRQLKKEVKEKEELKKKEKKKKERLKKKEAKSQIKSGVKKETFGSKKTISKKHQKIKNKKSGKKKKR